MDKIRFLKQITSLHLEIGHTIHHTFETLLRRLQRSCAPVDTARFIQHGQSLYTEAFRTKTFMEEYYDGITLDLSHGLGTIADMLTQFLESDLYEWILSVAKNDSSQWIIEPGGYGETRIQGYKAYCKMDFLLPVDNSVFILDWKSGKKQVEKHSKQLLAYTAAILAENPHLSVEQIVPKIIYVHTDGVETLSTQVTKTDLMDFYTTVEQEHGEMIRYCRDPQENVPREKDAFPLCNLPNICKYCQFREICLDTASTPLLF